MMAKHRDVSEPNGRL